MSFKAIYFRVNCFIIFFFRFIEVELIHNPELIIVVGVLGLVVNILGLFLFHGNLIFFL